MQINFLQKSFLCRKINIIPIIISFHRGENLVNRNLSRKHCMHNYVKNEDYLYGPSHVNKYTDFTYGYKSGIKFHQVLEFIHFATIPDHLFSSSSLAASYSVGTCRGLFIPKGNSHKALTHLHLAPSLTMYRALPTLPYTSSWCSNE
jgi:hypothetical protein